MSEGIYVVNSQNVTILDNRYQNITGPFERVGLNRANFVQLNNVTGALIDHNKGRCGDTEDIVSVYSSSNVTVEDNHFEGVSVTTAGCLRWRSGSGSGIALGDSGNSANNIARRNTLLNVGQVGVFIAGGKNHKIEDNTVIGQQIPGSNVGAYVWLQGGGPCGGHSVARNVIRWTNAGGTANPFWNAGNCGTVSGLSPQTNTFAGQPTTIDPSWRVTL